jgi:D-serine deaminase-like pyridoxal phosphate-dependent protein
MHQAPGDAAPPEDPAGHFARLREAVKGENLPAAIVDLDAFDRNAAALALAAAGKPVRLATKSLRVPELISRALRSSPLFRGLLCYSAQEARFLASKGFDDLLVAYPTLQRSDLAALREIHESGKTISLVVDGAEGVAALALAMEGAGRPFRVVIEVDASLRLLGGALHLGVRRSPVRDAADLERRIDDILRHPSLRAVGMMAYEAQVAGLTDRNPFKPLLNPVASLVRAASVRDIASRRRRLADVFLKKGLALEVFNGGGTGSLTSARGESALTEVSAGSALFSPHLFDYYSNIRFEPAAFFALQVVRVSDPGYATCQGGGYVASGEPGWDRVPRPWLPEGLRLVPAEACGEVQTPLRTRDAAVEIAPGMPVFFRHAKAGELMERFREVLLIRGGRIEGRAPTYRGSGQSFF